MTGRYLSDRLQDIIVFMYCCIYAAITREFAKNCHLSLFTLSLFDLNDHYLYIFNLIGKTDHHIHLTENQVSFACEKY